MAYFSNGTEAMIFEEDWCSQCVHSSSDGCPVMLVHSKFNRDQFPEHAKTEAAREHQQDMKDLLSTLISEELVPFDATTQEGGGIDYTCHLFHALSANNGSIQQELDLAGEQNDGA